MVALSLVLAAIGGLTMAVQSPTNAELSRHIGNYQASVVSFGGGTLLLLIAILIDGNGTLSNIGEASWWQYLGGVYGAFIVLMVTFGAPVLGIALTLTFNMLGQMVMGMTIDQFGLFLVEASPVSFIRIIGCLAVGLGIVLVYIGKIKQGGKNDNKSAKAPIIAFLCFLSGMGSAVQSPTNVALATHIGKVDASFISFLGGFIVLLIACLIVNKGKFQTMRGVGIKPWMVIGGSYGVVLVVFNIIATPYLGVALVVAAAMFGQLGGAIVVDACGLLKSPKIKMNAWRYLGVAAIAIGVILVTIARS